MTPPMQILGSLRSPYCRKVMIFAEELGLTNRVELVPASVGAGLINPVVQNRNPLGKVPVLVVEDGQAVYDSLVICLYLERLAGAAQLAVSDSQADLRVLQWHALGQGLTDVLLQWNRERARAVSKRTDGYAPVLEAKVWCAIAALDALCATLDAAPFGLGHAAIISALGYLDFRFEQMDWRHGHPRLCTWFEKCMTRPSCANTKPS